MSDGARRLADLDDAGLEAVLLDLAGALDVPPARDVSAVVAVRLRSALRTPGLAPFRLRLALVLALAVLLALAAIAAAGGFGLPGLRILFAEPTARPTPSAANPTTAASRTAPPAPGRSTTGGLLPPTAFHSPSPVPTVAPLPGSPSTVTGARQAVAFSIALPDPLVAGATPSRVFLDRDVPGGEVLLLYLVADGPGTADLPVWSDGQRVAFVLTESKGSVDEAILGKVLGSENTISTVDLGRGVQGLWIAGPVHSLLVYDATGAIREEQTRLVGNVLAWVRAGTLFRMETDLPMDEALKIARSVP